MIEIMTRTIKPKSYIVGLSFGTFWLVAASSGFAVSMLSMAGTGSARIAVVAVVVLAMVLAVISLPQIVAAMKLPSEPRSPDRRRIGRSFAITVVVEVAGIMLVNAGGYLTGHLSMLVPLDLIIVGLHFFPLAKLFGVPRYATLGVLFCTVSILTLLMVPADAHAGAAIARFLIASLGCAASAWLISIANLFEVRRLLSKAG